MLSLYDFKMLPEADQVSALHDTGKLLATRQRGSFLYRLYQMETFYVELKTESRTGEVNDIRTFINQKSVDNYLPFNTNSD